MTSNNYKNQLVKEAKQLDSLLGQDAKFDNLIREITDEHNERASLELIKELGILVKKSSLSKIEDRQKKIIELLYMYWGSKGVEELHRNLKEVSNIPLKDLLEELYELIGLDNVKQQV